MMRRLEERIGTLPFHLFVWIAYAALVFTAYSFVLKLYFIQDDFGFITRHLPGGEAPPNKAFIPEGIYYRPFTQHIWYYIVNPIFKLNPFYYHLVNPIVHAINIILVYHIGRALTRNVNFGLFLGLIYGTRTLAYHAIVWPSAVNELIVTLFLFATFLTYQRYVATGSRCAWWGSVILFLMAVLSKENAPTLLILLFVYHAWVYLPKKLDISRLKQIIASLWPHILMVVLLAAVKITQFAAIQQSNYQMSIGKETIRTYLKFFLSFTNPPAQTIHVWRDYYIERGEMILVVSAAITIAIIVLWLIGLKYKRRLKAEEFGRSVSLWDIGSVRLFIFGCAWWVVAFFVTATMPTHAAQYYGLYPGFGLALAVAAAFYDILLSLTRGNRTRIIGYALSILVVIFLLTNYYMSVEGIRKIDWFRTSYLASEAKHVTETMLREIPDPAEGAHFIMLEGDGDFWWVTSSGYQLMMIYNDQSIKVSFPRRDGWDSVEAHGKPDYYILFRPNGVIPEMKPHTLIAGDYEKMVLVHLVTPLLLTPL